MLASTNKISTKQAVILFITVQSSPAIRIIPRVVSRMVGRAGWLLPLLSVLPFICLVVIMHSLFKKNKDKNLADLYLEVFGRIAGTAILTLCLLWLMILFGFYVRYFSERFLSSLLPRTSPAFFYLTILAASFYAVRGGMINIARTVEFLFSLFTLVFAAIFLFSLPNIQLINLLPVTQFDILPLVKIVYPLLGLWGYFSLVFFFGDKINDKEHIRRFGLQGSVFLVIVNMMLLIQTIGVYGHTVIQRIPMPYFVSIKSISLLETIERVESAALAFWIFVDFTIICFFLYLVISIMKSIFSLKEAKYLTSPAVVFAFIFASYSGNDALELEKFSNHVGIPVNIFVCFVMPALLLAVGKIRKMV
ncbi:MAG: GerAB/ArcD/ProY family transporter [Caldicoprobacterales bacterium]|nr:endospore germination permease [Clostridiales bacterium]